MHHTITVYNKINVNGNRMPFIYQGLYHTAITQDMHDIFQCCIYVTDVSSQQSSDCNQGLVETLCPKKRLNWNA